MLRLGVADGPAGFEIDGYLPRGIHAATLVEVVERFGSGSPAREQQAELLRQVVEGAKAYPTIKRVLVWGSFITDKAEPNDLDYSIVVSIDHADSLITDQHRRFFIPLPARIYYGLDRGYLKVYDYPIDEYADLMDFFCHSRFGHQSGVIEISV